MPKLPKATPSNRKEKRSAKRHPESAEDWLAEAISLEDSGDRWVQDPPKAERFYRSSLEAYDRALALDGTLFDAAFNRARLFLQVSQACALLAVPRLTVVTSAIVAHRELAVRYPDNGDVRYNLAMVLMHYAELVCEHKLLEAHQNDGSVEAALREAFESLEDCRRQQTSELEKLSLERAEDGDTDPVDDVEASDVTDEDAEMEVDVSYISFDVLADTLLGMVECYVQMLEQVTSTTFETDLTVAESLVKQTVMPQLEATTAKAQGEDLVVRVQEATHALDIAELECQYRQGRLDLSEWRTGLEALVAQDASVAKSCATADACVSLAAAMASSDMQQTETWKVLTNGALAQITKAIDQMQASGRKCPNQFITKGDIELLRAGIDCDTAKRNRTTLLKNATTYYTRAVNDCLPKDIRLKNEAALKSAIVQGETSTTGPPAVPAMTKEEANQIISDARADGLLKGSWRLLDVQ